MTRAASSRPRRLAGRIGVGIIVGAVAAVVAAGAASAHVRVSGDVQQGGSGVITFRAPSESATASTTELTVTFPTATPIVSVDTQPMPGWKSTVTTAKLAKPVKTDDGETDTYVAKVDWTAQSAAAAVPPGEFQLFNLEVSGLPDVSRLTFPTVQRYSDGSTVNWNEIATGSTEPQHPAPVLMLAAAGNASSAPTDSPSASMSANTDDSNMGGMDMSGYTKTGSNWQGITGMIAGILGLIAGLIALARTSRAPRAQTRDK